MRMWRHRYKIVQFFKTFLFIIEPKNMFLFLIVDTVVVANSSPLSDSYLWFICIWLDLDIYRK